MSNVLTSNRLIKTATRRGSIPKDQNTFDTDDILDILNEEMIVFGIPHLLSTYEEYLVTFIDFDLVSDKFEYEIPSRAVGNKLRDASIILSSGDVLELSRISLDEVADYDNIFKAYPNRNIFYIRDNKLVFVGEIPSSGDKVRMYFYMQPNVLVKDERAGVITDIDTTTGIITMSNFVDDFSNLPKIDFIKAKAPNKIISFDLTPTAANKNVKTITFDPTDISDDLQVGDYVNVSEETIVPQLPTELHPILSQRANVYMLESLGDGEGLDRAQKRLKEMEESVLGIINDRVEGAPQKIVNRFGSLRSMRRTRLNRNRGY